MTQARPRDEQRVAFDAFLPTYPRYEETAALDELRTREFTRLEETGQVYLDYTGARLYAASHVRRYGAMLTSGVFGNPHSHNPPSSASTAVIESCRRRVLGFFDAVLDDYAVIFTGNASQALKLVGEAYPFESGDQFLLTFDNYNSVNGIRELLDELLALRHPNGRGLVRQDGPVTWRSRGGTIAFNFCEADGSVIDHQAVEHRAGQPNIALRTGCFCNPGAGEVALGLSEDELTRCFRGAEDRMNREDLIRCIDAEAGARCGYRSGWSPT